MITSESPEIYAEWAPNEKVALAGRRERSSYWTMTPTQIRLREPRMSDGEAEAMQTEAATSHSDECRLAIGDFCCLLVCRDAINAQFLRKYYAGFLVDGQTPDLVIEIDVVKHPPLRHQLPDSLLMTKQVSGKCFDLGSGLLKGTLHLSEQLCTITVKQALFRFIRIFEQFLYLVYYTLLHSQNINPTSYLIHAAGVVRENQGFIFTGRSGSGKSEVYPVV